MSAIDRETLLPLLEAARVLSGVAADHYSPDSFEAWRWATAINEFDRCRAIVDAAPDVQITGIFAEDDSDPLPPMKYEPPSPEVLAEWRKRGIIRDAAPSPPGLPDAATLAARIAKLPLSVDDRIEMYPDELLAALEGSATAALPERPATVSDERLADHLADVLGPRQGTNWEGAAEGLRFLLLADGYEITRFVPRETFDEADDMCPNCVTPWKCNGPHLFEQTVAYLRDLSENSSG